MRIRYSPHARRDLTAIYQYLFDRSSIGATNVLTAIYAAIEFIRRNPRAGDATVIPGVRRWIVRSYRFSVFYRIAGNNLIEIVHIRHTSRQPWTGEDC